MDCFYNADGVLVKAIVTAGPTKAETVSVISRQNYNRCRTARSIRLLCYYFASGENLGLRLLLLTFLHLVAGFAFLIVASYVATTLQKFCHL